MENATQNSRFSDKFPITNFHTWQFVLLSFTTAWLLFWMYTFSESLNKHEKRVVIHLSIPIIAMLSATIGIILIFPIFACPILVLCVSFLSKPILEKMLAENGTPRKLNGFLCFLIPMFYQYYIIRNAEEHFSNEESIRKSLALRTTVAETKLPDKIEQLEKLAKLKQSGGITEEEFVTEKKKILSESE